MLMKIIPKAVTKRKFKFVQRKDRLIVIVGISLIVFFYGLFLIYPAIKGFIGSFFNWNPLLDKFDFAGLSNYFRMFRDDVLIKSFTNTLIFTISVVIFRTFFGLIIALGINSLKLFKTFLRSAYFLPVITSLAGVALVWTWLLDPNFGIINRILMLSGINVEGLNWLENTKTALLCLILVFIWKTVGLSVVIYLAGLSNIPKNCIEAANIDGAGPFAVFRHIRWPLLSPATTFVVVTGTIESFQIFVPMFIMTQGGPLNSTTSVVMVIFSAAFRQWRFGYAAAISQVLFFVILIVSLIQFKYLNKN